MVGQPLRLGPFVGGLNTVSDPTAIADAELALSMNFELDIDGSLISRPPIVEVAKHANWTERIVIIGAGIFSGVAYIFGSNTNGTYFFLNGAWTSISATLRATVAVQYADKMWFVPGVNDAGEGGNWVPPNTFTTVAAIPVGGAAVIHKERLYIIPGINATTNTGRLKFCEPGDFTNWPASNFVDISQGDGTNLIDLTVYQDNVLLFKEDSTYVFAYDVRPADAVVRQISKTIGVTQQHCMMNYENQIYIYHRGWVYEIINYDFHRLNTKVPFALDQTAPSAFSAEKVCLSQLGDRVVICFFNKIYVYGLRTRTWTEFSSDNDDLHYFGPLVVLPSTDFEGHNLEYYAGSRLQSSTTVVRIKDAIDSTTREKSLSAAQEVSDTFTRNVVDGWGNADTGQAWTILDAVNDAPNFDVNGTKGTITHDALVEGLDANLASVSIQNVDTLATVSSSVVVTGAAGAQMSATLFARFTDINNWYGCQAEFKTGGTVTLAVYKDVATVVTQLDTFNAGAYLANEEFRMRFQVQVTTLRAKIWKAVDPEPASWNIEVTDSAITGAGSVVAHSATTASVTNTLPINVTFDNVEVADFDTVTKILCSIITKNFDMAVPHQFKRLWWWGADLATNEKILGQASPIVLSFDVTWQDLSSTAWNALGTWAAPLSSAADVVTTITPTTGTARRFAKFLRGLRYRQINFRVDLQTDGSTVGGPARLFSLLAITESKQVVPKQVN